MVLEFLAIHLFLSLQVTHVLQVYQIHLSDPVDPQVLLAQGLQLIPLDQELQLAQWLQLIQQFRPLHEFHQLLESQQVQLGQCFLFVPAHL